MQNKDKIITVNDNIKFAVKELLKKNNLTFKDIRTGDGIEVAGVCSIDFFYNSVEIITNNYHKDFKYNTKDVLNFNYRYILDDLEAVIKHSKQ